MVFGKIEAKTAVDESEKDEKRTKKEMNLADDGRLFRPAVDDMVDNAETELDEDRCEDDQAKDLMAGVEISRLSQYLSVWNILQNMCIC